MAKKHTGKDFCKLTNKKAEGYLVKSDPAMTSWKRRLFVLDSGILYYFPPEKNNFYGKSQSKGGTPVEGANIEDNVPETVVQKMTKHYKGPTGHLFTLEPADGKRMFVFSAETPAEKRAWVAALRKEAATTAMKVGAVTAVSPIAQPQEIKTTFHELANNVLEVYLERISCDRCVEHLAAGLSVIEDIKDVDVDQGRRRVTLGFGNAAPDQEMVAAVLEDLGFLTSQA